MTNYLQFESPLGPMLVAARGEALVGAWFLGQKHFPAMGATWHLAPQHPILWAAREQLEAYFAGRRRNFDLPLNPAGTEFQIGVWKLLTQIGYGQNRTYGELAGVLGSPNAARAVGVAVGRNPLSVIVPCHRVLGAAGVLTGYAGGLDRKRQLLGLERGEIRFAAAETLT